MPEDYSLTESEQAEYDRQVAEEASPYFHSWAKCGQPLTTVTTQKIRVFANTTRSHKIRKKYCPVHEVELGLGGWQLGFAFGEKSDINAK